MKKGYMVKKVCLNILLRSNFICFLSLVYYISYISF